VPSGVTSVGGLLSLIAQGRISPGQTVCCLLTGSGLKDPASVTEMPEPPVTEPTIAALARAAEDLHRGGEP